MTDFLLSSREIGKALRRAARAAIFEGHALVGLRHLTLALLQPGTDAVVLLQQSGVNVALACDAVAAITFAGPYESLTSAWSFEEKYSARPSQEDPTQLVLAYTVPDNFRGLSYPASRALSAAKRIAKSLGAVRNNTVFVFLGVVEAAAVDDDALTKVLDSVGVSASEYSAALKLFNGPFER